MPIPIALAAALPYIIAGGTSIIGSGINAYGQKQANEANIQMQRETNAANLQLAKENREYNSPVNQVRLLREAGINPVTAYGGLSSVAKSSPAVMESPKQAAVQFDMNSIIQNIVSVFETMQQSRKTEQEIVGIKTDNNFKADAYTLKLDELAANVENTKNQTFVNAETLNLHKKELELKQQTVQNATLETISNLKLAAAELGNKELDNELKKLELRVAAVTSKYAEAKTVAELKKTTEQTRYLMQDIKKLAQATKNEALKTGLLRLELNLGLQTQESNVQYLESKALNEKSKLYLNGIDKLLKGATLLKK